MQLAACKAELVHAHRVKPRTEVWYDPEAPWNARWTLDESSFAPILWLTFSISGALLLLGLAMQRKRR